MPFTIWKRAIAFIKGWLGPALVAVVGLSVAAAMIADGASRRHLAGGPTPAPTLYLIFGGIGVVMLTVMATWITRAWVRGAEHPELARLGIVTTLVALSAALGLLAIREAEASNRISCTGREIAQHLSCQSFPQSATIGTGSYICLALAGLAFMAAFAISQRAAAPDEPRGTGGEVRTRLL